MLKEIIKVANKLDSLGLTKEADILDNYISKIILDKENVRNASLFEGAFDTIKELFGKGKSREEEAAEHFTTINPIWPKMQAKLERDKGVRITVQKNLGVFTGEEPNEAYDKYIPSEWQNSREDIRTYRKAMSKVLSDYISTLNSTEETDKEKKIKEYEEMREEQEVAKRWVTDRGIVDNVMGRLGIQSELRDMVRKICFQVYLRYFKIGNKNPYSIDIVNDVISVIEDASFGEYAGPGRSKYNSEVLGRAIAKAQSLNLSNLSKSDDTSTY